MSLNLYSENGVVGQVSTNQGWGELIEGLEPVFKFGGYQNLQAFLKDGESEEPKELKKEVSMLLKSVHTVSSNMRDTLTNLQKLLGQCEEIAIVSE